MPKAKTRKSLLKRFKVTAGGKVLRKRQFGGHRRAHKSKRQIHRFSLTVKAGTRAANKIKSFIHS